MRRRLYVSTAVLALPACLIAVTWMTPLSGQVQKVQKPASKGNGQAARPPQFPVRERHNLGKLDEFTKDDLAKFVKSLSQNDATIQVIVRQGRLISLQSDLVTKGPAKPFIAIGDPRVIDVEPVDARHLRITGRTMGVTDLAIVTADRKNYNFEIEVVPDLTLLKVRLKEYFPDAKLELKALRQHVIVAGEAQSSSQERQILEMIRIYLSTVETAGTVAAKERSDGKKKDEQEKGDRVGKKAGAAEPSKAFPVETSEGQEVDVKPEPERNRAQVINLVKTKLVSLIRVVPKLDPLKVELMQAFPNAQIELKPFGQQVIVAGQARDSRQVAQILKMIEAYLTTVELQQGATVGRDAQSQITQRGGQQRAVTKSQIINLLRVPGPQQILLKVQVAELNRTALRQLGVNFLIQDQNFAIGQNVGGGIPGATAGGAGGAGAAAGAGAGTGALGPLLGLLNPASAGATAFGVFERGKVNFFFTALRQNQVLKVLAEPNLVAMNGQTASFLAGGEFPVPVPQATGSGAGGGTITIQYKEFGVKLDFVPYIMDDDRIRLAVQPEVSSIDFTLGTTIQGTSVPALNTRRTNTTVELREGQTLAISGILQVTLDGTTARIPGLGDLPYIGSMFRNTSSTSQEKELIVMVTPYLVQPMEPDQVLPKPGDDVDDPTDIELYLLGRIERRACRADFRATTAWDDPLDVEKRRRIEERNVIGPYGYTQ